MIYLANLHTDVRIDFNTKYQILEQDKIVLQDIVIIMKIDH